MIKRIVSTVTPPRLSYRHEKGGEQKINKRAREQECPREVHQLVITEARKRSANPDIQEQERTHLTREPEDRDQDGLHHRDTENDGNQQKSQTKDREAVAVDLTRGLQSVKETDACRKQEHQDGNVV